MYASPDHHNLFIDLVLTLGNFSLFGYFPNPIHQIIVQSFLFLFFFFLGLQLQVELSLDGVSW